MSKNEHHEEPVAKEVDEIPTNPPDPRDPPRQSAARDMRRFLKSAEEVESLGAPASIPIIAKPSAQDYFRVHAEVWWNVSLLKVRSSGSIYLLDPGIHHPAARDHRCFFAYTRVGRYLVWPIILPTDGDETESARGQWLAAHRAMEYWTFMAWTGRGKIGHYEIDSFPDIRDNVVWPVDLSENAILGPAFEGRIIDREDHPVLEMLPRARKRE
jgi:hypothetical protein